MNKRIRRRLAWCAALAALLAPAGLCAQGDSDRRAWAALAGLGDGFVVWESNRENGAWRIWRRALDGSDERCLSPEEVDRDHICPAVSPDGQWVVYMSLPRGIGYNAPGPGVQTPLRLVRADGSDDRVLVGNARRITGGNRAVLWVDAQRLHFLDGESRARAVDIRTGTVGEPLLDESGYMPNAALTYAFDRHFVHPFDAATRSLRKSGTKLGGCEPTFTSDNRWSVRMADAGGPIARVDPATSRIHPLLQKNDARVPKERGYLYFPMVSPCRRLLAWAASPGQHDHEKSDYDVFVMPIDPDTLEPTGRPARYSFNDRTDRYPFPYLADLPLGRHAGEAPFTVHLTVPGGRTAHWQSGDGATGTGTAFTHRYAAPGRYAPAANSEGREWRGQVTVLPAAPPTIVGAALSDPRTLSIVFDEPVEIGRLQATLASRIAVHPAGLSEDGRRLTLRLAADAAAKDELTLGGFRDRAQQPNAMPVTRLPIERARWPVSSEGLLLAIQSGGEPSRLRAESGTAFDNVSPELRGLARHDRNGAFELACGAAEIPAAGPRISRAVKASGALTLEAVFCADDSQQQGPARIVTLSRDTSQRNLTLGQERDRLVLRLRTSTSGGNGMNPQAVLGAVTPGRDQHVVVTYRAEDGLRAYLDGEPAVLNEAPRGDLSNWEEMRFLLGDEVTGDRDWRGRIEGVAIYDRALTADEVRQAAAAWRQRATRAPLPRWRLETVLLALSPLPTLQQVSPYREGLVLAEHRVTRAEGAGAPASGTRLRVAHWALLDGRPVPATSALRPGASAVIEVEPLAGQPQVRSLYLSDELDVDLELPLVLDVTQPAAAHRTTP